MSYSSRVVIRIESEKEILDNFINDLKERLGKYWENDLFKDYGLNVKHDISAIIIDLPGCNWYILDKNHYSRIIENVLRYYEDEIAYHFLRIGEDLDDIEEEINGEMKKYLTLIREIKY